MLSDERDYVTFAIACARRTTIARRPGSNPLLILEDLQPTPRLEALLPRIHMLDYPLPVTAQEVTLTDEPDDDSVDEKILFELTWKSQEEQVAAFVGEVAIREVGGGLCSAQKWCTLQQVAAFRKQLTAFPVEALTTSKFCSMSGTLRTTIKQQKLGRDDQLATLFDFAMRLQNKYESVAAHSNGSRIRLIGEGVGQVLKVIRADANLGSFVKAAFSDKSPSGWGAPRTSFGHPEFTPQDGQKVVVMRVVSDAAKKDRYFAAAAKAVGLTICQVRQGVLAYAFASSTLEMPVAIKNTEGNVELLIEDLDRVPPDQQDRDE